WSEQKPVGTGAGRQVAEIINKSFPKGSRILIAARASDEDKGFADALDAKLKSSGFEVVDIVQGMPIDARRSMQKIAEAGGTIDVIGANQATAEWPVFKSIGE